jgi:hypothetical protein
MIPAFKHGSRVFMLWLIISLIGLIWTVSCDDVGPRYAGETLAKAEVVEVKIVDFWQYGKKMVARVKFESFYLEFEEDYFGNLNPRVGDCVKIWVTIFPNGPTVPHSNRKLLPCSTK